MYFVLVTCVLGYGCCSKSVSQRTTCGALCFPGPVGSEDQMRGVVFLVFFSFISIACECVRCMCDYRHLCAAARVCRRSEDNSGESVLSCQLAELRSLLFLPLWYPRLADLRTSEQFSQDLPFYHGILGLEMCAFSNLLTQVPGVKVKLPALQSKLFHPLSHLTSLCLFF